MENNNPNTNLPKYNLSFLLNKTFELTNTYIKEILFLGLILTILITLIDILTLYISLEFLMSSSIQNLTGSEIIEYLRLNIVEFLNYMFFIIMIIIIIQIINLLVSTTFIYYVDSKFKKQKTNIKESFLKATNKIWIILITQFIFLLFLTGLFFLLIIPAIIFGVYWSLFLYSTIIRDKNYIQALKYSKELIKNNWWRTLGYFFIIGLIIGAINFIFGMIFIPITNLTEQVIINEYYKLLIQIPSRFIATASGFILVLYSITYFKVLEKEKGIKNELD